MARTTFLTAPAAARHMIGQGSGVILAFGELGGHGIRFVTLSSGGIPETLPEGIEGRDAIVGMIEASTLLGRAATLEDWATPRPSPPPTRRGR